MVLVLASIAAVLVLAAAMRAGEASAVEEAGARTAVIIVAHKDEPDLWATLNTMTLLRQPFPDMDIILFKDRRSTFAERELPPGLKIVNVAIADILNGYRVLNGTAVEGRDPPSAVLASTWFSGLPHHSHTSLSQQRAAAQQHETAFDAGVRTFMRRNIGQAYLPLWAHHNRYTHYWLIEQDVRHTRGWAPLFHHFQENDADLVSMFRRCRGCAHWDTCTYCAAHNYTDAVYTRPENKTLMAAFLPVCRYSTRLLDGMREVVGSGLTGHHELLSYFVCLYSDWCRRAPIPNQFIGAKYSIRPPWPPDKYEEYFQMVRGDNSDGHYGHLIHPVKDHKSRSPLRQQASVKKAPAARGA